MADIKKIKLGETTYNLRDSRVITLTDSGSTTAGTWVAGTGSPTQNITAYEDGQLFLYKITKAGAATTTLNVDGLGAKTIYRSGTSKLTTHYDVGQYLLLAYNSTNDCFRVVNDYDANTTYSSKTAASGGTDVSLVTTGEKYNWNVAKTHADSAHAPSDAEKNVQSDWNVTDTSSDAFIKNKPTIPTVNNATLTIQKNGTNVATFTANSSTAATANITVPTKTSDLTNDSSFIKSNEAVVLNLGTPNNGIPLQIKASKSPYFLVLGEGTGDNGLYFTGNSIEHFNSGGTVAGKLKFLDSGDYTYTLPARSGTLATTDQIQTVNNGKLTLNVGGVAVSGNDAFTANDATNTTYNVPSATASAYGVVKVSSVNSSAVTVNSESTTAGRYYPVELNNDGKAIVNVPWSDTNTNTASAADNILDGSNSGTTITYAPYSSQQSKLSFDTSTTNPTRTDRLNLNGYLYATKLYSGGTEVLTKNTAITGATKCKITYDADGLVTAGANLAASDIPSLASSKITAMTGYAKASAVSAISTSDSLNTAIGKLEKALDSKGTSSLTLGTTSTTAAKGDHTHSNYVVSHNGGMTGSLEILEDDYGLITLGFGYDGFDEEGCIKLEHTDSDNFTTYAISGISHRQSDTVYSYNFPTKTGTLALTSDIKSLVSNTTSANGIKYITEASFTNGVLTLESKYLHLS